MPDLRFEVSAVEAVPFTAAPLLAFKLRIGNAPADEPIESILLRCQVRIDAERRRYEPGQQARLVELFGAPERWSRTLRPLLWTSLTVVVPRFAGATEVDLPVPCSSDLEVTATKLFHGLRGDGGELPLTFLFSGTVFYEGDPGLQVTQIPWTAEAAFRLPLQTWSDLMDAHHPGRALLSLSRDVVDRLYLYRTRQGLMSWDQVLDRLLALETNGGPVIGPARGERPAS